VDLLDAGSRDFLHAAHNSAHNLADETAELLGGDDETQEMDVLLQPEEEESSGTNADAADPAKTA